MRQDGGAGTVPLMRLLFHRLDGARRLTVLAGAAVTLVLVAAAIGSAAIPSAAGVISACKKADGSIRIIDREAGQACSGQQQLVEWNQKGPTGPAGPVGPAGPAGVQGPQGYRGRRATRARKATRVRSPATTAAMH